MDDIKWYTPVRQSDGSYKVVAKASDHENVDGRYERRSSITMHRANANLFQSLCGMQERTTIIRYPFYRKQQQGYGTFDVIGMSTVLRAFVWFRFLSVLLRDGQDDIRWYGSNASSEWRLQSIRHSERPQKFYRLVLCPTLTIFKMTVVSRRVGFFN